MKVNGKDQLILPFLDLDNLSEWEADVKCKVGTQSLQSFWLQSTQSFRLQAPVLQAPGSRIQVLALQAPGSIPPGFSPPGFRLQSLRKKRKMLSPLMQSCPQS